jgi:hypothetical protein
VAHGRTAFGEYHMRGEQLYLGDSSEPCADFASTDAIIRHGGYMEIGLPYPFQDRISDADWESGAFLKTLSERDKKSGLYPPLEDLDGKMRVRSTRRSDPATPKD